MLRGRQIEIALALTVVSYLILTGYDALALRYLGRPLPYRRTALASFLGYAFAHNIGLSVLGGAAPRYRLYAAWELPPVEIALLIGFTARDVLARQSAPSTGAGAGRRSGRLRRPRIGLPSTLGASLGGALLAIVRSAYRRGRGRWRRPLTVARLDRSRRRARDRASRRSWSASSTGSSPPRCSTCCCRPARRSPSRTSSRSSWSRRWPASAATCRAASACSRPSSCSPWRRARRSPALVGALLVYRVVYYLLPLAVATLLLGRLRDVRQRSARLVAVGAVARPLDPGGRAAGARGGDLRQRRAAALLRRRPRATPTASTGCATCCRCRCSSRRTSSPASPGSACSCSRAALQRRLDAAYHLAVVLLAAGAVLALLQGLRLRGGARPARRCSAVLLPCRGEFYRRASLIGERFTLGWVAAVAVVCASRLGLARLLRAQAHRVLAASCGGSSASSATRRASCAPASASRWSRWRSRSAHLLRPARAARRSRRTPTASRRRATSSRASPVAARASRAARRQVVPVQRRPAAPSSCTRSRAGAASPWAIRSGRRRARASWCGASASCATATTPGRCSTRRAPRALPLYLDVGLTPLKFGEEARVSLPAFTLEGSARKQQRYVLQRDRARRRDLRGAASRRASPRCCRSCARCPTPGCARSSTREKGFSLGCFDPDYLAQFPVAVVRREGRDRRLRQPLVRRRAHEEIVARPDALRCRAAPPSVDGVPVPASSCCGRKDEGYRWFNLGMAPLAGLEARAAGAALESRRRARLPPRRALLQLPGPAPVQGEVRSRVAAEYLVCPGGLALPRVLANVARAGLGRAARRRGEVTQLRLATASAVGARRADAVEDALGERGVVAVEVVAAAGAG